MTTDDEPPISLDIDSMEVELNYEILQEIRRLIISYRTLFGDFPQGIAIEPKSWLELGVSLVRSWHQHSSYSSASEIQVDGVKIFPKLNGPPEVIPAYDHIKHIAWMKEKDDKRLWPLLTGA